MRRLFAVILALAGLSVFAAPALANHKGHYPNRHYGHQIIQHHFGGHHHPFIRHYGHRKGKLSFGITVAPRPVYRHHNPKRLIHRPAHRVNAVHAHRQWCFGRYRSYRAWDNTFQPYHGPRRACRSPYGGH